MDGAVRLTGLLVLGMLIGSAALPSGAARAEGSSDEHVATQCADCPNYDGAFAIRNQTGVPIKYQVRWGKRNKWQSMVLETNHVKTHRYPLGEDPHKRIPTPYVRFDDFGGDGKRVSYREMTMQFYATGYAGYGPTVNRTKPKGYHFIYKPGGTNLDLVAD